MFRKIPVKTTHLPLAAIGLLAPLLLGGCLHDDDDNNDSQAATETRYRVSVTNLTNNQPLSPVAVVLHRDGYTGWTAGAAASIGLEALAEGGDNSGFIAAANAASQTLVTATGTGAILPGASEGIEVVTDTATGLQLTVAAMLVNTNDAFTGVTAKALGTMAVGDRVHFYGHAYDAGSEANSETAASIPGMGGEGLNAARDDKDFVSIHHGVVTADDGLATSALDESQRFMGPVGLIVVERLQ